jgi:hypothetical protein
VVKSTDEEEKTKCCYFSNHNIVCLNTGSNKVYGFRYGQSGIHYGFNFEKYKFDSILELICFPLYKFASVVGT